MSATSRRHSDNPAALALASRHRFRWWEALPWLLALAFYFAFPRYLGFGTELLITVLFAISLDLALGYAGIVTLGHAAFFGAGAYTVGMLAKHGIWTEPITGLVIAAVVAGLVGLASGLVLLRTTGLTLLMLTLCTMGLLEESANMAADFTGGFDGLDSLPIKPMFGRFEFDPLYSSTQYLYVLGVLLVCFIFVRTLVYSPFGQSLTGIRENMLRMHAVGAPVRRRLVICYAISAAIAGIAGALWAQANAYVNLSALGLDRAATVLIILVLGGYGRLYGAIVGAVAYMVLAHFLSKAYPTAWQLGLGLLLVVIALFARGGILGIVDRPARRRDKERKCAMTALLETRSLSKNFGALRATRDVTFQLEEGARHALIGPNGAGKTTFINLLTGVLTPSAGQVLFKGQDITQVAQAERVKLGIARTFQINRLFRGLSVLENVYMAIAERVGAAPDMLTAGRHAPRRDRRGDGAADAAQARRRRAQDHSRIALWPPAAGRACHHARAQARSAAARRAGRRRAERREPHHPRRHRRAAEEHRRADHRPRHGPGVPLRQEDHRAGARRGVRRGHAEGDRRQSGRARGLSRAGRPMADRSG